MVTFSTIISFLVILCLVIVGLQNSTPLEIKLAWWTLEMSLSAALTWAAAAGGVAVALMSLPRLSMKAFQARRLRKEVRRLEDLCKCTEPGKAG